MGYILASEYQIIVDYTDNLNILIIQVFGFNQCTEVHTFTFLGQVHNPVFRVIRFHVINPIINF